MLEVFFKGKGDWYDVDDVRGTITGTIQANGVFRLTDDDEITYKYSKSLDGVRFLLPSTTHSNSEFLKLQRLGLIGAEYSNNSVFRIYYNEYQWNTCPKILTTVEPQTEAVYINWNGWLNREEITIDEALFLSMGEHPYDKDQAFFQSIGLDEPDKYKERRKIAESWRESGQLPYKIKREETDRDFYIKPLDFFRLARDSGWLDLLNPQLDPIHQFLERNETELKAEAFRNKKISNAPKPITPLTGGHYVYKPPSSLPPADYETWSKADLWTIERGILLLLNAETLPNRGTSTEHCKSDDEQRLYDDFMKIWAVAESSLKTGLLKKTDKSYPSLVSEVLPSDFIYWATAKGYPIPIELKSINVMTQAETVADDGAVSQVVAKPEKITLSKLEKQQAAILAAIQIKKFEPMAIPDGEKGTIEMICRADDKLELFKADTSFDRAWKQGIGTLWKMEYHDSYARRGNK